MTAQAPLVVTVGGTVAVLMWLVALGLYVHHALRTEGVTTRLIAASLLTRIGLLIGTVGWGSYVALTWPQPPWRVVLLPPVALAALLLHMVLTRRISSSSWSLCLYGCAVVAYGAGLAPFRAGDGAGVSSILPTSVLVVIRELAAVVAAGALLVYGTVLLLRRYPAQVPDTSRVERVNDEMMCVALVGVTVALAAAAWRAWLAWGEMARTDVTTLFVAWAFITAASLWQMMSGRTTTWMVHGLALLALVLLIATLVLF